jgi:6-phosphogluconolactonase (cycloisomerase 2 family)
MYTSRHRFQRLPAAAGAILPISFLASIVFGQAQTPAVFVANNGNLEGSVTAFRLNPDGTLEFVNRIVTGSRPNTQVPCPGCNAYEIAISPSGSYLATGHASSNDPQQQISIFEVAPDASINQIGAFMVPRTPMDVVWISDELLATVRTDTNPCRVTVYRLNPQIPSLTEVASEPGGGFSTYLAIHPSRQYLYVNNSGSGGYFIRAWRVEPNGTLTLIDTEYTGSYYPLELTITNDGTKLYAAGGITHVITGFHIAPDGTLSPMAGSPFPEFGSSPSNVFPSSDDHFLIVGHGTDATMRTASIDPYSGALTYTGYWFDVGTQGTLGDVSALEEFIFVTDNSMIDGQMGIYSFRLHPDGSFTQVAPIYDTQGIAPRSVAVWKPQFAVGDLNCDGLVNAFDIDPFTLALTDPDAYQQQYPSCNLMLADVSGDGQVNAFDIDPFVELLTGR